MMRKPISFVVVSLVVFGGFLGMFLMVSDDVEGPGPTYVSGIISVDTVWTVEDSPYIVTGNVLVEENITLNIEPGVEIRFDGYYYIWIDGTFNATGTETDMITFTSNLSSPAKGDWSQIKLGDASNDTNSIIKYCIIKYGFGILCEYSAPTIMNNLITNNNEGIITIRTNSPNYVKILNNTISNNDIGINIHTGSPQIDIPFIYNNIIKNNGQGIRVHGPEGLAHIDSNVIENNSYGIYLQSAHPFITNNLIQNNSDSGIYCHYSESTPEIMNNTIIKNWNGIYLDTNRAMPINYNNLYENINYNIFLDSNSEKDINATYNWWGTNDPVMINDSIHDYYDDFDLGKVIYMPFLTSPVGENASGLQEGAPWPMFRGNVRHTGLSPYDTSGNPGNEIWSVFIGDGLESPAIDSHGTIYVGAHDNKLYAINSNGTIKWSFTTGDTVWSTSAIGSDGTIYVGSWDNKLYAINPDGTEKWNFTTGNAVQSSPAIGSDGTIYLGSLDNKLYAVYPNGTKKWSFTTGGGIRPSPAIGTDGTIYIGSNDDKLYAINPNGTEKWNYMTNNDVQSSPAIGLDDTIYIGSTDNKLYAINLNGTEKWSFSTGGFICSSPAIGPDNTIYAGSWDNKLYAINPDGTEKWNFTTGDKIEWSSPAIGSEGTIYVGSFDNKLYAINSNGTEKWSYVTGHDIPSSSPAIDSDGTIYVGSFDHKLHAIGTSTPNQPPVADAGLNQNATVNQTVYFDGSSSYDPDGDILTYNWDFGDGNSTGWQSDCNTSHVYNEIGTYTIILTVSDGELTETDSCVIYVSPEEVDTDGDGIPDSEDYDDDNDGYTDIDDDFPLDPTEDTDTDGDGTGNNVDTDDDGDGVPDVDDDFPLDSTEDMDTDDDDIGNNADPDDDNDGYSDDSDAFPLDPSEWLDADSDGVGNNADPDDDNDGYDDAVDDYPLDPSRWIELANLEISGITLSKYNPAEGEEVTIYITIQNVGDDSCDAVVKFFDGDPNSGGTQIGPDLFFVIPSNGTVTASVKWTASTGDHTIYAVVEDLSTHEKAIASLPVSVGENIPSILVLTTGDTNIYRFEPGQERTISVEVTCYLETVENVHLVVLDEQNLTIDHTVTPPRTMTDGETIKFYLRVKAPQLPEGVEKLEKDIVIQVVGDNGVFSNAEELDIVISESAVSFLNPIVIAGYVAMGSVASVGAAAVAARRNENWKYLLLLLFAVPLYTRIHGKKTLDNFVRGQVYGHIQSQPGTHFNDIRKTLKLGNGNLAYHLRKLEKEGFIYSRRDKRYRRFYSVGVEVPDEDGIILSQTQEDLLDFVEQHPQADQKEMAKKLKESQQTVSYNLNVLVREGFLREEKIRGTKHYEIMEENT